MKKITLFCVVLNAVCGFSLQAQGFAQLGTYQVEDQGYRMIFASDGGFITAGSAGSSAVLYKTDCLGSLLTQKEASYNPGPAIFYDVVELADGNLLAVGEATINVQGDTSRYVLVYKTSPDLVLMASARFSVLGKEARGASVAETASGDLLVWGEVLSDSVNFVDVFLQKIDPVFLQPVGDPVIFDYGLDLAGRMTATDDGNYLLTSSSASGDFFDPLAILDNDLHAIKVDQNGTMIWQAAVHQAFPAKYGLARVCGAAQGIESKNFMLGGTMFNATDDKQQDVLFILISNDGTVLDTAYADAPGQQRVMAIAENTGFPGYYVVVGDGDGSPLGVPSLVFAQGFEVGNQIISAPAQYDITNPVSLRDQVEVDPGRFAFMGTVPDNPLDFTQTDIIISTPEASVGIVYQNCALAATLSTAATGFQWLLEGQPIPGANQGAYFPTEPGLYVVQILDDKGCFGVSDTFRVSAPVADFSFDLQNLTATFSNGSSGAVLYSWDFGDGSISNASNPVHTYASNGTYTVQLIAKNNCGLADTIIQNFGVVSAKEPSWLEYFKLSPNPTLGAITIEMSGEPQENLEFSLSNAVGQLISQGLENFQSGRITKSMDFQALAAGVYTLQIRSGKESKNVRVIKQ